MRLQLRLWKERFGSERPDVVPLFGGFDLPSLDSEKVLRGAEYGLSQHKLSSSPMPLQLVVLIWGRDTSDIAAVIQDQHESVVGVSYGLKLAGHTAFLRKRSTATKSSKFRERSLSDIQ